MSSYQGHEFKVVPIRGRWPMVERDSIGVPRYRATIVIELSSTYRALHDLHVIVDPIMPLQNMRPRPRVIRKKAIDTIVEGELIVPIRKGITGTFTEAILVGFNPQAYGHITQRFYVDAEWIITSADITPVGA